MFICLSLSYLDHNLSEAASVRDRKPPCTYNPALPHFPSVVRLGALPARRRPTSCTCTYEARIDRKRQLRTSHRPLLFSPSVPPHPWYTQPIPSASRADSVPWHVRTRNFRNRTAWESENGGNELNVLVNFFIFILFCLVLFCLINREPWRLSARHRIGARGGFITK
ncbi:hypothetical protein F4781DRAFT_377418 [Annulohypoxylon bovei var. microspora]|nr:hypothetical protein F4781DRAFT_377418 [Annulohypoxylon bovei var. microspora]